MKSVSFFFISLFVSINTLAAQEQTGLSGTDTRFERSGKINYPATNWNPLIGVSQININNADDPAPILDNFICDAILERAETDFSFINKGDITSGLYAGEITMLDLYALCPLDRTLVVLEVDGAFLMALVEKCLSGYRKGLAVGGAKIEYSAQRPSGNRLTYFQIGNYPAYPKKEYRVVTTDYLADGHAGFDLLTGVDSSKVFKTNIPLREALKQYIQRHTPLGPASVMTEARCIRKP